MSVVSQNNVRTKLTLLVDQLAIIRNHLSPLEKSLSHILSATDDDLSSECASNFTGSEVDLYDLCTATQKDPSWLGQPIGIVMTELMSLACSLEGCFRTVIEMGEYFREVPRPDQRKEVGSTESQMTKRSALSESLALYKQKKEDAELDRRNMRMTYARSRREIQSDFVLMRREEKRLKPKDKRWGCCF